MFVPLLFTSGLKMASLPLLYYYVSSGSTKDRNKDRFRFFSIFLSLRISSSEMRASMHQKGSGQRWHWHMIKYQIIQMCTMLMLTSEKCSHNFRFDFFIFIHIEWQKDISWMKGQNVSSNAHCNILSVLSHFQSEGRVFGIHKYTIICRS